MVGHGIRPLTREYYRQGENLTHGVWFQFFLLHSGRITRGLAKSLLKLLGAGRHVECAEYFRPIRPPEHLRILRERHEFI